MKSHYVFPGKLAAFNQETVVTTLLGSCVAVALHDPENKVGGLNHYLLPESAEGDSENPRYGQYAIPMLIDELIKLGAVRKNLQAKIYGGANVISMTVGEGIGKRNIELAERMMKDFGIPIMDKNVAGEAARTIKLNTSTFEVVHKTADENSKSGPVDVSGFKPLATAKNVKVLIVDDSATVRTLFANIFQKNGLEVVGTAADAYQAREMIVQKKPDVVTLDIEMPKMSGVMFLEKLMKHLPIPVVMVSSLSSNGEAALKSLELGAIEFVHKPSQFDPAVLKDLAETLIEKVKAAASINVLNHLKQKQQTTPQIETQAGQSVKRKSAELKIVTVGGNAGSAPAIEQFVKGLAADTPPVVVACSTIASFVESFIQKMKGQTKVTMTVAKDGDHLRMGAVYFAPPDHHVKVTSGSTGPILKVEKGAPVTSQIPSSNVLFQSACQSYAGGVYAILFGGFGADGVEGLTQIQNKGGFTTVQHPEQAQFPFGPQKAIELGVADEILKAEEIATHLMKYRDQNLY